MSQEDKTENMTSENSKDGEQISEETPQEAEAHEYVTGIKLFIILAVVTLVFFLLMLDMSIVTNVCPASFQI
jgi:hypothetical protein